MRNLFYTLVALFLTAAAQAQPILFSRNTGIPVSAAGQPVNLPWAGGLHAPQFSRIDLNGDGIRDLMVFDRSDGSVLTFLNSGAPGDIAYTYAPDYAWNFPPDLMHWVLLADFNCDGLEDLFTSNPFQGVTVWRNTSSGGNVSFALETANLTTGNGFQIEVPATDIPAILDVDGDGDLDILAFDFGGIFVTEYRNNQSCGITDFSVGSQCWGKFAENATNSGINLNVNCRPAHPYSTSTVSPDDILHAGSTLLLFDANGDGFMEALIGDISSTQMTFLTNSAANEMVSQTTSFPPSQPVDLFIFPASFYQDVDNDGVKDLLVAPNVGADPGGKNYEQVLMYKNHGSNSVPSFALEKNDFLVGQMLEFGSGSAPAFFDYDGDGDLDLLVGNYAYRESATVLSSRLALLRNTGTTAAPEYELIDDDYLNLSALSAQFLTDLAPAFGDLDGDGDMDLLLGKNDGSLMYYENTAGPGQPVSFNFVSATYQNINVGLLSKPHIVDINRDGLPDLLIGERNGNINYYRNTGTATMPEFVLETPSFGGIDLFASNFGAGNSAPFVADLDSNGVYDLLVGERLGKIHIYPNFESNLTGTFIDASHTFWQPSTGATALLNFGLRAVPAAADLNGDGLPDLMVGTLRGGLGLFYNNTGLTSRPGPAGFPGLKIWPNPVRNQLNYQFENVTGASITVRITDIMGRELQKVKTAPQGSNGSIDMGHLPVGMYLLQFMASDGRTEVRKVMKE